MRLRAVSVCERPRKHQGTNQWLHGANGEPRRVGRASAAVRVPRTKVIAGPASSTRRGFEPSPSTTREARGAAAAATENTRREGENITFVVGICALVNHTQQRQHIFGVCATILPSRVPYTTPAPGIGWCTAMFSRSSALR